MPDEIACLAWDNDQVATYTRLSAFMNTRWARDGRSAEDAGRVKLRGAELRGITDRVRLDAARRLLEHLAEVEEISVEYRGDVTVVEWPKFPIFQNYRSESGEDRGPENAPSATRVPRPATRDTRKNVAPWASPLAQCLADRLRAEALGAKIPAHLDPWAQEIAQIGRPEAEVEGTIDWLFSTANTGQYAFVVQSGRALRAKYGQIRARMMRDQPIQTTAFAEHDVRTRQYFAEGEDCRRRMETESPEERARTIAEARERPWRRVGAGDA